MVPGSRRARAGRPRRRRLLRAQHAEVRSDPDVRAADVSALLAIVSPRHQELARRKGLGPRHHLVVPRRAAIEDPVHRPPPVARGRGVLHRADRARRDPDRRRRRRVGDAHGRPRETAPRRRRRAHAGSRSPVSALARHAVFDLHRVSRLRGERGRVQSDGARRLRTSDDDRRSAQADPAHAGRRVHPRHGLLRVPDDGGAIVFAAIRRSVRPPSQPVRADRPRDGGRTALRRLRRQRPAGARGHAGGHRRARCTRKPACRICVWPAGWRSTASRTRGFSPSPASSACSSRPPRATRAARWARRSMPIAFTSATRIATCPIIRSGDRRSTGESWRERRAKTISSSRSSTTRC